MEQEVKRIGKLVSQTTKLLQNKIEKRFRELNIPITYEQMTIINCFCHTEKVGYSQLEIAEKTGRDQPCTSRLIDNLMKQELLVRVPDEKDRRVKIIYLTDAGKEIVGKTHRIAQEVVDLATEGISDDDVEICKEVLYKMKINMKKEEN